MTPLADEVVQHLRGVDGSIDLGSARYRTLRRVARGGMGTVYLCEDTELGREVALKVLSLAGAPQPLVARLEREARVLARLEHPGIVPIHDIGRLPDGRLFYVMKLVRGKRLDEWLGERPPRAAALRIFARICDAVAFAHTRGVIHRDLKPENVMIGAYGEALVMDFGVAKLLAEPDAPSSTDAAPDGAAMTADGAVVGTPAYMAPEQARGQHQRVDERTDVYALGALLYFALSGRPPFEGMPLQVLQRVVGEVPPPLRGIDPSLPRPLVSICDRAMHKCPESRYSTATELAADVSRFLDGQAVLSHRESLTEKLVRISSRYRVVILLLLAYLLMRAAVLLFAGR